MFPGGGLPSFASAMWVIKNPRRSRVRAAVAVGLLAAARKGLAAHARAAPAPAPRCQEQCGRQGAVVVQSAGGETHQQTG